MIPYPTHCKIISKTNASLVCTASPTVRKQAHCSLEEAYICFENHICTYFWPKLWKPPILLLPRISVSSAISPVVASKAHALAWMGGVGVRRQSGGICACGQSTGLEAWMCPMTVVSNFFNISWFTPGWILKILKGFWDLLPGHAPRFIATAPTGFLNNSTHPSSVYCLLLGKTWSTCRWVLFCF